MGEERQATPEELERFLQVVDKSVPDAQRTYIKFKDEDGNALKDSDGNPLGVIVWREP